MKRRFILYRRRRGGMFYVEDTVARKQESLGTRERGEALAMVNARNEAIRQPHLNLQIAKAYLAGTDSAVSTRTWQHALDVLIETKHGPTMDRWRRAAKESALDLIRDRVIIETQAEPLLAAWRFLPSTLMTAMSVCGSVPMTLASNSFLSSASTTLISSAPSTTWLL